MRLVTLMLLAAIAMSQTREGIGIWIPANKVDAANAWCKANFDKEGGDKTFTIPVWDENDDPTKKPPKYYTCSIEGLSQSQFNLLMTEFSKPSWGAASTDFKIKKHGDKEKELKVKKGGDKEPDTTKVKIKGKL